MIIENGKSIDDQANMIIYVNESMMVNFTFKFTVKFRSRFYILRVFLP